MKRRSGRKPGARVTNPALARFKVVRQGRVVILIDLKNMADNQYHENILDANILLFALKQHQLLRQQLS